MKRRDFLKAGSATAAGSVGMLAGFKPGQQFDSVDERANISSVLVLPANPDALEHLGQRFSKSALIIGGGVAGLAAAYTLAKKGFKVTLREAAPY